MIERERRAAPRPGPYRPSEVDDAADSGAVASESLLALGVARELERVALEGVRGPSARLDAAFVDRVMSAVATEPLPAPAVVLRSLRGRPGVRRLSTLASAVGDVFRVAVGPPRPFAVRAPALAIASILVAVVGVGALGGLTLLGGLGDRTGASLPAVGGMPSSSIQPSPLLPMPSSAPAIAVPAAPTVTPVPVESVRASGRAAATPASTSRPTGAPRPTVRPTTPPAVSPTPTPHPTETSDASHSAEPTGTPEPTSSPEPTSGSGG